MDSLVNQSILRLRQDYFYMTPLRPGTTMPLLFSLGCWMAGSASLGSLLTTGWLVGGAISDVLRVETVSW